MNEHFKMFYDLESRVHEENQQEMFLCLHKNVDPKIVGKILDAKFGTVMETFIRKIEVGLQWKLITEFRDRVKREEWLWTLLYTIRKSLSILFTYIDMFKDSSLGFSILITAGGFSGIMDFPTNFSSVVVISIFCSIIVPLLISSLHLSIYNPFIIWNIHTTKPPSILRKIMMSFVCFICTILNPILLIIVYERLWEKSRRLGKYCWLDRKGIYLQKKLKHVKSQLYEFLKIELGLEVYFQAAGQIILFLFSMTETPTTGGLETIFGVSSTLFLGAHGVLAISILLSMKSSISLHMKSIKLEKGFFPFKSIIFVLLWGLFATLRRTLGIVAFFIPSLGLFDILHHFEYEKIKFKIRMDYAHNISSEDKIAMFGLTETVYWTELDRWNYTNPKNPIPPDYSLYTGLKLQSTFASFFVLMGLQFAFVGK